MQDIDDFYPNVFYSEYFDIIFYSEVLDGRRNIYYDSRIDPKIIIEMINAGLFIYIGKL